MPCLRCGAEYGIFRKESYCRNCGFSYCTNCLTKKIIVPKLSSDTKHAVCHKCFGLLSSGQPSVNANRNPPSSPPAALQRRMDVAESASTSHSIYKAKASSDVKVTDSQIASRLENLRSNWPQGQEREAVPSLSQLEDRLARLKDWKSSDSAAESTIENDRNVAQCQPEVRTTTDQVNQLYQQMTEEVKIESMLPRPEDEIRHRLDRLRAHDESLNDLNKQPAQTENGNAATNPAVLLTTLPVSVFDGSATVDPEVFEVWQYMVKAEEEARLEADEALRLQEKDQELRVKLEEIRANRDIAKRLPGSKLSVGELSDEDNEDKLSDKVIHQFLNEARLEVDSNGPVATLRSETSRTPRRLLERKLINSSNGEDSDDCEELPWCTICNEDASLRCYGCEGDLYCRQCFRECHDTLELKDHPSALYTPKMRNGH